MLENSSLCHCKGLDELYPKFSKLLTATVLCVASRGGYQLRNYVY